MAGLEATFTPGKLAAQKRLIFVTQRGVEWGCGFLRAEQLEHRSICSWQRMGTFYTKIQLVILPNIWNIRKLGLLVWWKAYY